METDGDRHVCSRELPVWRDSFKQRCKLRFITPDSRLLLNGSQPESGITDDYAPPGYQVIAGRWVAITPELQLLRSPPELPLVQVVNGEGNTEIGSHVGTYHVEMLFRWVECHQPQFGW